MNSSSPAVAPDTTSLGGSRPEEDSPNEQRNLGESEAMRRVQDLLAAGKLSVSDTVIFEYFRHSFSARIMADGSLRSHTDHKREEVNALSMLYSSPSEFASAMATSVAILDDKGTKPKGKVAINGWKSCTVDGRSLATIRNEMLYERKNELASLSKERVRESAPVLLAGKQSEPGSEESPRLCESSVTGLTAGTIHSLQGFGISSRNRKDNVLGNHPSLAWKKKPDLLSDGGDSASGKCTEVVAGDEEGVSLTFEGKLGANSSLGTHHMHKSTEKRKLSSPEAPINPISERSSIQRKDSLQASAANPGLFDKMRHDKSFSEVFEQRNTAPIIENVTKLEKQKSRRSNVGHSSQWQGNRDGFAKNGSETKCFDEIHGDEEKSRNLERISTLAAEPPPQTKIKEQKVRHNISRNHEEIKGQVLDGLVKTTSSTKAEIDITNESKGSSAGSKDSNGKNDNRLALVEQCDEICTAQREMVTLQVRSSKEVSDLQQEILGDSDSEEESFLEPGNGHMILPKKRSCSSSSDENRKKTRTGDHPDQEMGGVETKTEAVEGLGFDDKTPANHNTKTNVEATHLDPDTVEAAAIAAQIEKEEASTRARRTTRLAAGKIKQVDYKTSTGQQVPRSISPEMGWEDSNKRSIEIEHTMDIVRTTRRRSAPNQWQPPQRSSRRVATKLRSGYDREMLSNEETDYHSTRADGRGLDLRVDRQAIPIEDMEGKGRQGFRLNDPRADSSDRRRGRTESSSRKARYHFQEDGDPHSHGRPLSVRAGTRDNYIADGSEIADLSDPDDFLSDAEDLQGVSDADDDSDLTGMKRDDIKYLAEAVRFCESADPRLILKALNEQDHLKNDDFEKHKTRDLLQESMECIQNMQTLLDGQKGSTCPSQLLSFLAAETWRFVTRGNTNESSRKPTTLMKRAGKEDLLRTSIERSRKKEHRDVEELRASLEKEMECRRRAELDSLFVEIHFSEVSRAVAREKTKCCRLKQETEKYRDMERVIQGRLEGAKVLVGQLRGETDESDAIGVGPTRTSLRDGARIAESLTNGSFVLPSFRKGPNERIAEDYAGVTNKNVTTTSRRLMEMDRLRTLIAAREVEAEEFQRICEKERMHFVRTMELKTRLETELYLSKSQGSATHGFGNSSTLTVVNSAAKDGLKKGDIRGSSTHTTRGPGYIKQKTATSGKNATVLQFTNKLPIPGSRPKPGRAVDGPKHLKKKHPARNGGNGGNGNDRS